MAEDKKSFTAKFAKKKGDEDKTSKKKEIEPEIDGDDDSHIGRDKNSFMDHIIRSRGDLCYHVMGRDITGRVAWYFILIDKEKKDSFLNHNPGDSYDLADYGKIIVSGYGEEVPEDVKEMLKEKYGFDNFD